MCLLIKAEEKVTSLLEPILKNTQWHMAVIHRVKASLDLNNIHRCPAEEIIASA